MNTQRRNKLRWMAGGTILLFLLVILAHRIHERIQVPPVEARKPLPVEAVQVSPRPFPVYVDSVGTVTADHRIMISARVAASVVEVPNREGAYVEEGDLLVRLDDEETKREHQRQAAVVERTQTELSYWRKELGADHKLFEKGVLDRRRMDDSRRRVDALDAALREAKAVLELAQVRLGWTRVTAPFPGYVQSNVVLQGEQVSPGAAMVELVAAHPLKVIAPVAESDLDRLAENQLAIVYLPALGQRIETRVHRIYPALDSRSRNATVELTLPPDLGALRPGMAAQVNLRIQYVAAALAVPRQAVRLQGAQTGVFVIEAGKAQWRPVKTGVSQSGEIVLLEGVDTGDRVIVTPHPGLFSGRGVTETFSMAQLSKDTTK